MFLAKMSDEAVLCEDITFVKTYKKDTNVKKKRKTSSSKITQNTTPHLGKSAYMTKP
jgi:hypothetical protein